MNLLEAQRRQHLEAARILLSQLRSTMVWSDGRNVYRGKDLRRLRQDTLARIISLKEKRIELRRVPEMARMCDHLVRSPGYLGRGKHESTPDWLVRILTNHCGGRDPGSLSRAKASRRILSRHFPDSFKDVPLSVRFGDQEYSYVRKHRERFHWAVAADIEIDKDFTIRRGCPATPSSNGFVAVLSHMTIPVPETAVSKVGPIDD